ncbi:hypothetical protein BN183_290012 [Clostridioides difficile E7]|nr:hypothetical protein BN183_290012 [Clostridioides difficile E7]
MANELLENLDRLHTTELGVIRINNIQKLHKFPLYKRAIMYYYIHVVCYTYYL